MVDHCLTGAAAAGVVLAAARLGAHASAPLARTFALAAGLAFGIALLAGAMQLYVGAPLPARSSRSRLSPADAARGIVELEENMFAIIPPSAIVGRVLRPARRAALGSRVRAAALVAGAAAILLSLLLA